MICDPSTSGRRPDGTFAEGNKIGKGNPLAGRIAKLRAALIRAIDARDVAEIMRGVIERAKSGDLAAARLVLLYCTGEPAKLIDDLARKHPAASLPRQTVRELIGAEDPQRELPFAEAETVDTPSKIC